MTLLTERSTATSVARGEVTPPELLGNAGGRRGASDPLVVPVPDGERARPETDWARLGGAGWYPSFGRRALDFVLLGAFSVPALVLGLIVALGNLIVFRRLGEVFFVQPRVGFRGEVFPMIKFRTMREVRATSGEFGSWGSGEDRLRVTRFGKFLRNTHLDELPQLVNVLRGEMAVVGPRPEMIEIEAWAAAHVAGFTTRLAVPPGITGYAQVTQGYTGNDVDAYREKFRVADWYRRNQSLRLDLEILVRTAVWMIRGRGWQWNQGPGAAGRLSTADD
jgi:lipopolysaccharide/colanic/teichoic acid biosynthesis glycosyltransferase